MNRYFAKRTLHGLTIATLLAWAFATDAEAQEVAKDAKDSSTTVKQQSVDLYGY